MRCFVNSFVSLRKEEEKTQFDVYNFVRYMKNYVPC